LLLSSFEVDLEYNHVLIFLSSLVRKSRMNHISNALRHVFEEKGGIRLSQNVSVSIKEQGSGWLINDRDTEKIYSIRKEKDKLNIYDTAKEETDPNEILMDQGIPLPTLPEKISLYTVENNKIEALVQNFAIKKDELLVSPTDLEGTHWMTDFEIAVNQGMGTKIKEPEKVAQIDQADWLIVVGVNEAKDSRQLLEEILRRNNARGELSIVAQDSPTNNTETAKSPHTELERDAEQYLKKTRMRIPDNSPSESSIKRLSDGTLDAHLLSHVLGLDSSILSEMAGAELQEQNEATAMATLLWDVCTFIFHQLWRKKIPYIDEHWSEVGQFFINHVRARSPLPVLRVGENPYGVLPVVSLRDFPGGSKQDTDQEPMLKNLKKFCSFMKEEFLVLSKGVLKLDETNDDEKFETLMEILRSDRVSKRVEVRPPDSGYFGIGRNLVLISFVAWNHDPKYLTCPLVKEKVENTTPSVEAPYSETAYLDKISKMSQPEIFDIDDNTPLLKRLIYDYTLLAQHVQFFEPVGNWVHITEAANLLKRVPPEKLEILLLEVLDLFSHRLDAWVTGLANVRLVECRKGNSQAPPIGVYGWLEKPGQLDMNPVQAEYMQAPSVTQANTAAILRNASLNNGTEDNSGPFQINLSSEQVRKGLGFLEGLRQGHLPEELLGYHLERLIHESEDLEISETDIFTLRDLYPLKLQETKDDDGNLTSVQTIINGEKFLEKNNEGRFESIRAALNQIKDAAADIAVAEITYQLMKGNMAHAGGWLDFMDGDCPPPEPEFIRTQRTGDIHGTKVFLPIEPPDNPEPDVTHPRVVADPILAHFCENLMPDFDSRQLVVRIKKIDGAATQEIIIIPATVLKLEPIDLVIGGINELLLRTRYHLLDLWKKNKPEEDLASPFNILGKFPDFIKSDELLNEVGVEIVPPLSENDNANIVSYFKKAELMRRLIHRTQSSNQRVTIEPEDIPLITQATLENLDSTAGLEMLVARAKKISTLLTNLIVQTKAAVGNLKTRHFVLIRLTEVKQDLQMLKDKLGRNENISKELAALKTKVAGVVSADSDFRSLQATDKSLEDDINEIQRAIQNQPKSVAELLDKLRSRLISLQDKFEPFVKASAKELVANRQHLFRWDNVPGRDSQRLLSYLRNFGMEWVENAEIQKTDDDKSIHISKDGLWVKIMLNNATGKATLTSSDWITIDLNVTEENNERNIYQYLPLFEISRYGLEKALTVLPDEPTVEESFKIMKLLDQLWGFLEEKRDAIASSIAELDVDNFLAGNPTKPDIRNRITATISILQTATDKEAMVILAPYFLKKTNGKRPDWVLDFSKLDSPRPETRLGDYREVRPAVKNILELFAGDNTKKLFEDQRYQRLNANALNGKKAGNTDYLYFSSSPKLEVKCLACLVIDEWQEFFPNMTETTGIAFRYDSPQAEAPNAILLAVPPEVNKGNWEMKLLANTILETIELLQARMVGSDEVIGSNNLGRYFPALLFGPGPEVKPLFPSANRLLHPFNIGSPFHYVLASELKSEQLHTPKVIASRE